MDTNDTQGQGANSHEQQIQAQSPASDDGNERTDVCVAGEGEQQGQLDLGELLPAGLQPVLGEGGLERLQHTRATGCKAITHRNPQIRSTTAHIQHNPIMVQKHSTGHWFAQKKLPSKTLGDTLCSCEALE